MKGKKDEREVFLTCKDYTVSGEKFHLLYDKDYEMLITSPQPEQDKLQNYYESENYISHTDARRSLFEKTYHWVKQYAIKNKLRLIEKETGARGKLLDIGAGTGDFLKYAQERSWEVFGIEPNKNAVSLAEEKGIKFYLDSKKIESGSINAITMWHVLEHVQNLDDQIKELYRLLSPDGFLFIAVPNYKSLDARIYKEYWAAYDVPRHLWHFSKTAIKKLMHEHSFEVKKIIPMKFDAYYVSLLSEKYKRGRMNPILALFNGFRSNIAGKRTKEYSSHIYILKKQPKI